MSEFSRDRPLFQYQGIAKTPFVPTAVPGNAEGAVTTAIGVSLPGKPYVIQNQIFEPVPIVVQQAVSIDWFLPLSQPTLKTILTSYTALTDVPFILNRGWDQPWSESRRAKPSATQSIIFEPIKTSATEQWFIQPWSEPARVKLRAIQHIISEPLRTLATEQWSLEPWSEPKPKHRITNHEANAWFNFTPAAVTSLDWYSPLSTPLPDVVKVSSSTVDFIAVTPNITIDMWYQAFNEPVRRKIAGHQEATAWSNFTPPAAVTGLEWLSALSEPQQRKRGLSAIYQQFLAFVKAAPFAENVTEDRWHQPWSEPVRTKPGLRAHLQKAFEFDPYPIPTVPSFGWFSQFSRPTLPATTVSTSTVDFIAVTSAVVTVTVDMWHQTLSEPVRRKRGLAAIHQQFLAFVKAAPFAENVTEDRWHQPWSEPVRTKPGIKSYLQQALALDPFPRPAAAITEDEWHQPWSEPVRFKLGLRPNLQQTQAFDPFPRPVLESQSHQPWSEPVRYRWFRPHLQQFLANPLPVTVFVDKWFAWFSEPVRTKKGLAARHQQFLALVKAAPFAETTTESRWHQPWSEPKRFPIGLKSHLQSFLAHYPTPVLAVPINTTMDATETKDVFFGYAGLYNTAAGANVSIHEIRENLAEVSIVES